MNKLQYVLMGTAFLMSLVSAMMWYGHGFHTWAWQIACMCWIVDSFTKQKAIERLTKKLED